MIDFMIEMVLNDLKKANEMIEKLNNNLNSLETNKTGVVTVSLLISEVEIKFVKVLGNWGVMCADGSWKPFCNIPIGVVKQMADIVQNVLKNK
jgi:hypothetical protein